jgi:hypothetical protein
MSPESDDREEMRPEYDIRGGERGKYFTRYMRVRYTAVSIVRLTFEESTWITTSTSSTPELDGSLRTPTYQPAYPYLNPRIQGIESAAA